MSTFTNSKWLNQRLLAIWVLGFASGLPLALTGSTLQAWFTHANIDLVTIGALSLLGIPYTLKFLWAPLMDYYTWPRLGKRRGWILSMQLGLVIALLILGHLEPSQHAHLMGGIALIIAFFSASQDISITAYQTDILPAQERGLGAAYYIFAYRVAILLSGGAALIFAEYLGWRLTYEVMAGLVALSMIGTFFAPQPTELAIPPGGIFHTIKLALLDFFNRDKLVLLMLFIVCYKAGDALALSLMTNFLLRGLGFTLTEVGVAYKTVSFVATILGAFIGGAVLTKCHIYRALLWFGLAQAFSNLMFVFLAIVGKDFSLMATSVFVENFCSGLSTAALLAFLMSLCNHRYTASQFALLSALASLARVFLGPIAGHMALTLGWAPFFMWSFILCFPGLLFLVLLKKEVVKYAHVAVN